VKRLAKGAGVGVLDGRAGAGSSRSGAQAAILLGFMGAGKSSVGRALSKRLDWEFEDLDERIERREGRKVAEIFGKSGEAAFRRAEHAALKDLLSELRAGVRRIVALGGGAFVQKKNARLLEAANVPTVFLDAGVEELWQRCRRQAQREGMERPLLGSRESFRGLYQSRRPHYLKAAFRQRTGGKSVERIAAEVVRTLGLDEAVEGEEKKL
jgi:shikimate kinase